MRALWNLLTQLDEVFGSIKYVLLILMLVSCRVHTR